MTSPLRVLVVDDSAAFRSVLSDAVAKSKLGRVVAHAGNGTEALRRAAEFKPDVITLDLEMPVTPGLKALPLLKTEHPQAVVVVLSGASAREAEVTMRSMELGAFDFISKPQSDDPAENRRQLDHRVLELLEAVQVARSSAAGEPRAAAEGSSSNSEARATEGAPWANKSWAPPAVVAIGCSTGGPDALARIIPKLPKDLSVPVLVVQHMPPVFTAALAKSLSEKGPLPVAEAIHGEPLRPGRVYLAPGGQHLKVEAAHAGFRLVLSSEPPEHFCRPAVDVLFRSVAAAYRERALGVILTGMGRDGALGLVEMHKLGARVLGQDSASCTVYGMPAEAKRAGVVDLELPLERIADEIVASVSGKRQRN